MNSGPKFVARLHELDGDRKKSKTGCIITDSDTAATVREHLRRAGRGDASNARDIHSRPKEELIKETMTSLVLPGSLSLSTRPKNPNSQRFRIPCRKTFGLNLSKRIVGPIGTDSEGQAKSSQPLGANTFFGERISLYFYHFRVLTDVYSLLQCCWCSDCR